jgi:hypothetical protein
MKIAAFDLHPLQPALTVDAQIGTPVQDSMVVEDCDIARFQRQLQAAIADRGIAAFGTTAIVAQPDRMKATTTVVTPPQFDNPVAHCDGFQLPNFAVHIGLIILCCSNRAFSIPYLRSHEFREL